MNVGKSSFLNMLAGQDVAITSAEPGTTTDVVEKTMELLPLGPVVFSTRPAWTISALSAARIEKTRKALRRADILALIVAPNDWSDYDDALVNEARAASPGSGRCQQSRFAEPSRIFSRCWTSSGYPGFKETPPAAAAQETYRQAFKDNIRRLLPRLFTAPPSLLGDLLPPAVWRCSSCRSISARRKAA